MSDSEADLWNKEWCEHCKKSPRQFVVFVDMRTLEPLSPDGQKSLEDGQRFARESGMTRSVVILANTTVTYQFKRIALQSGIYDWERYIDESNAPDWEQIGLDWLLKGVDPDASIRRQIAQRREREFDRS